VGNVRFIVSYQAFSKPDTVLGFWGKRGYFDLKKIVKNPLKTQYCIVVLFNN